MKPLYNEPRDYSRVWWPAVYVGEDSRLRGTHGVARHHSGDTWAFTAMADRCLTQHYFYRTAIAKAEGKVTK